MVGFVISVIVHRFLQILKFLGLCRYPVTLFNELYYLNAGGTIWTGISNLPF